MGVDKPTQDIIEVVQLEEGSAIRISGTAFGMMFTEQDYANYHLKLKAKWGIDKHVPKENEVRDSGLLYHGFGEPGSAYAWMNSHEMQIQEENMGDYIAIGDTEFEVPSKPTNSKYYQYDENSPLRTYFSAKLYKDDRLVEPVDDFNDSYAKMYADKENEHGEWNDIDLICYGDSSVHMVNGTVVIRLFNEKKRVIKAL